jgi:single-strand DNA-binding protein
MYYNKVILIGRLVREPENIMLPSGSQISNLVIAYNRNYKDQSGQWKEESHFFEIKVFGRLAERIIPQLSKGDLVLIEGRLHQDKWLDKESGEPRSKIRIVAFDIKLLSKAGAAKGSTLPGEDLELPSFSEEDLLPPKEEKKYYKRLK